MENRILLYIKKHLKERLNPYIRVYMGSDLDNNDHIAGNFTAPTAAELDFSIHKKVGVPHAELAICVGDDDTYAGDDGTYIKTKVIELDLNNPKFIDEAANIINKCYEAMPKGEDWREEIEEFYDEHGFN